MSWELQEYGCCSCKCEQVTNVILYIVFYLETEAETRLYGPLYHFCISHIRPVNGLSLSDKSLSLKVFVISDCWLAY